MKNSKKIALGCLYVLIFGFAFFSLLTWVCEDAPKTKPQPIKSSIPASVLENRVVEKEYITPDMNDSADAVVSKVSVSYWYVYYNIHIKSSDAQYKGYEVVELTTPYFTIEETITILLPKYKDEDFVGIEFFKRVPYETYKSFKERNH